MTVTIKEEVLVVVAKLHLGMIVDTRNQTMGSGREQWRREHLSSPLGSGYGPGRTCGGYCSKGFLNYRKRSAVCSRGEGVTSRSSGHSEAVLPKVSLGQKKP